MSDDAGALPSEKAGSVVGAGFGLGFVVANTGSLPGAWPLVLRLAAATAFVAVLLAAGRPTSTGARPEASVSSYALVVLGEVLVLALGLVLLNGPLAVPRATVAWISFVVGVHFFVLARLWGRPLLHGLGAALVVCGGLAFGLALAGSGRATVDVVGGVLPGALLLGAGLWRG